MEKKSAQQPAESAPFTPRSAKEAYDELTRELQVRDRCYGGWVKDGRLSRTDARDRYDRLKSALQYMEAAFPKECMPTAPSEDGAY